ncbi:uncharacterized protein LOC114875886 [Osmia bicornis bicornis]|uniref:uncharacterized protein LOC114875886 n=1 Tax=Osmia bicornis bicornis TaxID=1437191 RepID=UPI0010F67999|nr:uncharacterized protein LOC114875886 [Osmia bicornis bicornis]
MVIPDPWKLVLALSPKAAGPSAIEFYLAIHVCIDTPLGLKRNSNPISNPRPYLTFDADSSFTSATRDPTRLDMPLFRRGHDFGGSKHPQVKLTLHADNTFGMTTMTISPVPILSHQ